MQKKVNLISKAREDRRFRMISSPFTTDLFVIIFLIRLSHRPPPLCNSRLTHGIYTRCNQAERVSRARSVFFFFTKDDRRDGQTNKYIKIYMYTCSCKRAITMLWTMTNRVIVVLSRRAITFYVVLSRRPSRRSGDILETLRGEAFRKFWRFRFRESSPNVGGRRRATSK